VLLRRLRDEQHRQLETTTLNAGATKVCRPRRAAGGSLGVGTLERLRCHPGLWPGGRAARAARDPPHGIISAGSASPRALPGSAALRGGCRVKVWARRCCGWWQVAPPGALRSVWSWRPDRAVSGGFAAVWVLQALWSWCWWSLSRLCVAAISHHSDRTADLPRRENRRKLRLLLICANTGSTMPWRLRYSCAPASVARI
jgi:hypothetical protein